MTALIDALGFKTEFYYDKQNRLIETREILREEVLVTRYRYDKNGNRIAIIDPKENVYTYRYDEANRLIATETPLGNRETFIYDRFGRLYIYIKPDGTLHYNYYDRQGRLSRQTHTNRDNGITSQILYSYDGGNNLLFVAELDRDLRELRRWQYSYNEFDEMTGQALWLNGVLWKSVRYDYNKNGLRSGMTDPEGNVFSYDYDLNNRLTAINRNNSRVVGYSYNRGGRKIRQPLANGCFTDYSYDLNERLIKLTTRNSSNIILSETEYTHKAIGNRTKS